MNLIETIARALDRDDRLALVLSRANVPVMEFSFRQPLTDAGLLGENGLPTEKGREVAKFIVEHKDEFL